MQLMQFMQLTYYMQLMQMMHFTDIMQHMQLTQIMKLNPAHSMLERTHFTERPC